MNRSLLVLFAPLTLIALVWIVPTGSGAADIAVPEGPRDAMLERAEKLFEEGSYALAREIFVELSERKLPADQVHWVEFRLADSGWRSQAATRNADSTEMDKARGELERMIRDVARDEDRDIVWVEVNESLGDYWWTRSNQRNWSQAWSFYRKALDWWAGSSDLDTARERYLAIVRRAARPPQAEPYYYYGYHGNQLPQETLENALRISTTDADRAHANYLIAMTLRYQSGSRRVHQRTRKAFEAAIDAGRSTDWYDDALYHYAEWLGGQGRLVRVEGGGLNREPDFIAALKLYRRLTSEFGKGDTRYFEQAQGQIRSITTPTLGVAVSNYFLPDAEVEYRLNWRNLSKIELALYAVDLTSEVRLPERNSNWISELPTGGRRPVRAWSHDTNDEGRHLPGNAVLKLDEPLPAGAYLLEVTSEGQKARDILLVGESGLVLKVSHRQVLVFFCNAFDSSPHADAGIGLWIQHRRGNGSWTQISKKTDADGLALFDLPDPGDYSALFATAAKGDQQAFSNGHSYSKSSARESWRIYASTDRPAYRPDETVRWKFVARRTENGRYITPSGGSIHYELNDPRGAKIEDATVDLNDFGSAFGSIELGATLPLGEYRVTFRDRAGGSVIGTATLFRLEEYKLPEFKVSVAVPEEDDRPAVFRVGDTVEAEVSAEYYFGGPVADASVEVIVYQKPLRIWWSQPREFPWYYKDMESHRNYGWGGRGQTLQRFTLKTDADGRAKVRFDSPANVQQDFEYTIEARVTDASRREIVGSGTVRVSRQRYFAFVRPIRHLYAPGDRVRVEVKTIDANHNPLATEGRVVVTRDRWVEIWVDPSGRERSSRPASIRPGDPTWQLKSQGYEHEEILNRLVRTGDDGLAEIEFTPKRDGYYRIRWSGDQDEIYPVNAESTVWVADRNTDFLGYHHGGVSIVLDGDTFRAGKKTPVMLTAPTGNSNVLFTVEGDDLYDYRLVRMTGNVKLIELDVDERHVPNIFLEAVLMHDGRLSMDSRQVVVPPEKHFLQVEVEADADSYEPGEEGLLTVTTLDHEGLPVSAEVALGLVDESVFYIQQDYAGDPRQFFFGTKRPKRIRTESSFQLKRFSRPEEVTETEEQLGNFRDDSAQFKSRSRVAKKEMRAQAMMEADSAMPMAAAPMDAAEGVGAGAEAVAGGEPAVQVRSDFRSTAFWQPDVVTDRDGRARVKVKFPDSLTTWKAAARAVTAGSRFGEAQGSTRTSKPLIVRLQAPRFFVVGDHVTLSAVINNNTEDDAQVEVILESTGLSLAGPDAATVEVPAGGETRVDWQVDAEVSGDADLQVTARSADHADAMRRSYPVHAHGIEKFLFRSGKLRGNAAQATIDIPAARDRFTTEMIVQVSPSLAVTMLDALPYLIDYPYGCTEQTMSRFLPAVITAKTLQSMGLDPEDVAGRVFGGIEAEHASSTHEKGKRDLKRLDDMVRRGLDRLYDFQQSDGGWGWWKKSDSDPFMSAYVVWGLGLARDADVKVRGNVLERGAEFLDRGLVEAEERPDLQAWMLHAVTSLGNKPTRFQTKALDNLWNRRDALNAYSRALVALSAHRMGDAERAMTLVRNLTNGVKIDKSPDVSAISRNSKSGGKDVVGTAHWGEDGLHWRWSDGGVEATSFALRAMLAIDPDNALIEPVTNWLIRNRRGAQWSNTRDTAITVLTLGDYLETSGELGSDVEYEVTVNGKSLATRRVTKDDILGAPSRYTVERDWIKDGANDVRITRKNGDGPLYYSVEATFFSKEEPIEDAGNEIFVRRQYHQLVGRPTLLKGYVYDKQPLDDRETVESGNRIEVVLTIEAKNNYEYLVFEDLKPGGFEAVQLRSGESMTVHELKTSAVERSDGERERQDYTGRTRYVHQELRDRKVALFIDKLPEGVWEIRYELRAETPGQFHALPVLGHAMYVPEIRCNGAEVRVDVEDRR